MKPIFFHNILFLLLHSNLPPLFEKLKKLKHFERVGRGHRVRHVFDICMNLMRVCTRASYIYKYLSSCAHTINTPRKVFCKYFKRKFDELRKKITI